jgi:hypothetical protein
MQKSGHSSFILLHSPCVAGRVTTLVLDGLKKQSRFANRWRPALVNRPPGTQGVDVTNRLLQRSGTFG